MSEYIITYFADCFVHRVSDELAAGQNEQDEESQKERAGDSR